MAGTAENKVGVPKNEKKLINIRNHLTSVIKLIEMEILVES